MSQVTDYEDTIPSSSLNMIALKAAIESMFLAAVSQNRGAAAASNPFEGMLQWFTDETSVEILKRYTATAGWVPLVSVDISTGAISFYPSAGGSVPVRDLSRGLAVVNASGAANSQVDIDADEIILQDSNGITINVTSVDLTVDITESGADGLDTGAEEVSTWYYLWVISSGSVEAVLLSKSATSPTLPSGYTYKAFVGAIYNDASGNFIAIKQTGNRVSRTILQVLNAGNQTSATIVSLGGACPPSAKAVRGIALLAQSGAGQAAGLIQPDATGLGQIQAYCTYAGEGGLTVPFYLPLTTGASLYYCISGAQAQSLSLSICGWEF